ncbi:MFS transporter [Pendulispora rubella]|uniref:MFS transporter n=1 Tax=Pendulispora rubella TaxID=2741070 RepID=A0ABZ2LIF0_9BACT
MVTADATPSEKARERDSHDMGWRLRAIFGGSIGNLVEWYDWYAYSAFSLYFAPAFFPKGSQTAQLLNTAAIFAVGFLMRPIGGWIFGRYADRVGRKAALTSSVFLMSFGSLMIALTPGYASIGIAAPVMLVTARLLQGLSVGGEYGTSATYLSEVATRDRRGFYSSFQYVTLVGGHLAALAVQLVLQRLVLTPAELSAWGWRIPFVIGAVLAVVALYLRRRLEETESFKAQKGEGERAQRKGTIAELMRHPKALLLVVGLTLGGTVAFYTYTAYMKNFLVNSVGLPKDTATLLAFVSLFLYMLMQPLFGLVSDHIGRRPLLLGFGILGTLGTVPILTALSETKSAWVAFALMMVSLVIVSGYTSINAIVKAEMFPTEIRALGVGLPYGVTVAIFGGTAEYVGLWFKDHGHEPYFFWYVSACIFVSFIAYLGMTDTKKTSLLDRESAETTDR